MDMKFLPFQSVGLFKLDSNVKEYKTILSTYFCEKNEFGEYEYSAEDESHFLTVSGNKIRSVYCYEELIYKNVNLIGLKIEEFQKITSADYVGEVEEMDIYEDEPPEYVYEFEEIGLQVWTHYDRIVCIIASGHWSYTDD